MDTTTIITNLQEIFAEIFDVDGKNITRATSAKDVENWDSVAHVMLLTSIEKKFAIRFTSHEIATFKSIGDLIDTIERKQ
jgi:acyl carrier protein